MWAKAAGGGLKRLDTENGIAAFPKKGCGQEPRKKNNKTTKREPWGSEGGCWLAVFGGGCWGVLLYLWGFPKTPSSGRGGPPENSSGNRSAQTSLLCSQGGRARSPPMVLGASQVDYGGGVGDIEKHLSTRHLLNGWGANRTSQQETFETTGPGIALWA